MRIDTNYINMSRKELREMADSLTSILDDVVSELSEPHKYRKKPIEVEAMMFEDMESGKNIYNWILTLGLKGIKDMSLDSEEKVLKFHVCNQSSTFYTEGISEANIGDWVVITDNAMSICRPDFFKETYERI